MNSRSSGAGRGAPLHRSSSPSLSVASHFHGRPPRAAVKGGTELGIQVKKYMDAGEARSRPARDRPCQGAPVADDATSRASS